MATFTGSRGGGTTGPYLTLDYNVVETDVANNRSKVRLVLKLNASHRINFSTSKSGNLQGSGFSYTSGASGTGSWTLRTQDVWVGHNSDGSKSQSFSGSFNIAISYSGTQVSSLSVSGTATLPVIPRASTISAFSFGAQLQPSTAVTINYTVSRKSDNFRHQIKLLDGSHEVQVWDNISSNGASAVTLSTASVNSLLNRMSSSTSRALTLRIATRSGVSGGWIGSAVTKNATVTVSTNVVPTISALTLAQTGNTVTTAYLQGKSKVTSSFTRSGGYGATVASSSITVRRKGNNDDVQTINSNSGTTGREIAHSGTYQAQGMVRDSRGRVSYTAWTDFVVSAYTSPRITTFTAERVTATPTTVTISRAGTHSHLGGKNILTYTIQRRIGTGAWTNVNTNATGTSITASFTGTSTSTGNSVTSSYDFRMVITDKFGERAESIITVSTQRVVLDIHKNEGIGIGKIHEKGTLDVDGEIFLRGALEVESPTGADGRPVLKLNSRENNGFGFLEFFNNVGTRAGYVGVATTISGNLRNMITLGADPLLNKGVNFRGSDISFMETPIMEYGTGGTQTGYYVRFYNGLQVCWGAIGVNGASLMNVTMASAFKDTNYSLSVTSMGMASASYYGAFVTEGNVVTSSLIHVKKITISGSGPAESAYGPARYLAIGMWK